MTKVSLDDHSGPWTEDEFLALDRTGYRVELFRGGLWVSPGPNGPHQDISVRLIAAFLQATEEAGLWVRHDMNLRLARNTIMQPDLLISRGQRVVVTTEAVDVHLVCEITSPSNLTTDREFKKKLYADAGIKWYLLVEPDMTDYESVTLRLFRLESDGYHIASTTGPDGTLILDPVRVSIHADKLLGL